MSIIPKQDAVKDHFNEVAPDYDKWKRLNAYYYDNMKAFIKSHVRPKSRVLEVGCGTGEILASTDPSFGMGIDISPGMIEIAKKKYPQYTFVASPIEQCRTDEKFDYIVMVDVVDHVYDILDVFESLYEFCHPQTKIILTTVNPWWDPILTFMEKFGAKMPEGPHNFIEKRNIKKVIEMMNFSVNYSGYLLLFPKYIPLLSYLANTIGVRLWGIGNLSCIQFMILQPGARNTTDLGYGCSVVVPCFNEEKNIEEVVRRIPKMGKATEIIVVNDGSTDGTSQKVRGLMGQYPDLRLIDLPKNEGKNHALQQGFAAATQDVLITLDADLSVPPEALPRFFVPLNKGICHFVNGIRFVYPRQKESLRSLHLLGNKFFNLMMTFITYQDISDTLCGTKAFLKKDYPYFRMTRDRWGDFDLLFNAVRLGNKVVEVPVHYKERGTGEPKLKTFRHAFYLLKSCLRGFREIILQSGVKL